MVGLAVGATAYGRSVEDSSGSYGLWGVRFQIFPDAQSKACSGEQCKPSIQTAPWQLQEVLRCFCTEMLTTTHIWKLAKQMSSLPIRAS